MTKKKPKKKKKRTNQEQDLQKLEKERALKYYMEKLKNEQKN